MCTELWLHVFVARPSLDFPIFALGGERKMKVFLVESRVSSVIVSFHGCTISCMTVHCWVDFVGCIGLSAYASM